MITYGFSVVGKSHISKGTACQDSNQIKKLENGWIIAASADGVGSCKNSARGSRIAVDTVVETCAKMMPLDYEPTGIRSMIRTAFNYALRVIQETAVLEGNPFESYETTLDLVIYDGIRIHYGHSGDGGIIGLTTYGDFIQVTQPQKGEDGTSVIPLRAGYKTWDIKTFEENLVSVLLVTDGILDGLICPYQLRFDRSRSPVYIPVASILADPHVLIAGSDQSDFMKAMERYNHNKLDKDYFKGMYDYLLGRKNFSKSDRKKAIDSVAENSYPIELMSKVEDDRTIVGVINEAAYPEIKPLEYYLEPDWSQLQEEWNRAAFPHLYAEDTNQDIKEDAENEPQDVSAISESERQDASAISESEPQDDSGIPKNGPQDVSAISKNEPQDVSAISESEPQDASAISESEPEIVSDVVAEGE